MKLTIKIEISGDTYWQSKMHGVVLVKDESIIEPLFNALVEQDSYWGHYKNLIKVAPKTIGTIRELDQLCEYVGKTDIYNLDELKKKFEFIIYQQYNTGYYEND